MTQELHPVTLKLQTGNESRLFVEQAVIDYAQGKHSHAEYRMKIFDLIKRFHGGNWGGACAHAPETSRVCYELFTLAYPASAKTYYYVLPEWAQRHLVLLDALLPAPFNKTASSACYFSKQPQPKETPMAAPGTAINPAELPAVEHKVFIFGQDMKTMTDGAIFDVISDLEKQVSDLSKIEHRPQRIALRIAELQAQIVLIVDTLDAADKKE